MSDSKIIAPYTEAGIAEAVREAAEKAAPFEIVSGATKRDYGRPVKAGSVLDVSALSGIVKYEPEELVLTVRAATPMREIEAALAEKKQMLAFEPADWGQLFGTPAGRATLAGVVATNACGSRRVKAGAVRDSVIGCRFVNGRGEIVKAGGHVIKNVTGFDLPKLMCGAFGTLGVLTEITVRVSPLPECVAFLSVRGCDAEAGLRVLREAAAMPVDVSGLAYVPREDTAHVRVEGTPAAVAEKVLLLGQRFSDRDCVTVEGPRANGLFRGLSDGSDFICDDADIWRLCVPATNAAAAVKESRPRFWYADWAGGLLWLDLPADEETAARLRAITARSGGHATLMRAGADARARFAFEPEKPARADITRAVKAAFDPKRIFNPGRMFEGI